MTERVATDINGRKYLTNEPRLHAPDYEDIHSCSYSCQRPACIERQRNELAGYAQEIYKAVREMYPTHRLTFKQTMEFAVVKLKEKNA